MTRLLLLICVCLSLAGCRLGELLDPSPPPPPEKCFRTIRVRVIQNGTDTTWFTNSIPIPCED